MRHFFIFLLILNFSFSAQAAEKYTSEKGYYSEDYFGKTLPYKTCDVALEFKKSYEYILAEKDFEMPESKMIELSAQIAKGCDGAKERFAQAYELMKKSGVAITKSIEIGLAFSKLQDQQLKNFTEIFKRTYLEGYFDFSFDQAYKVSLQLSKDVQSNQEILRQDFTKLVQFCLDSKKLGLPIGECAKISLELTQHTNKYPLNGLFPEFEKLVNYIQEKGKMTVPIRDTVRICSMILPFGVKAVDNFKNSYEYAVTNERMRLDQKGAFLLAVELTKSSMREKTEQEKIKDQIRQIQLAIEEKEKEKAKK